MKKRIFFIIMSLFVLMTALVGCNETIQKSLPIEVKEKDLEVYFMDVGQGDSSLIKFPNGEVALVDGGTKASGEKLVKDLKGLGISKIDYLIGTHPHEDHIGGLPEIIRNFSIDKVYLPNKTSNTKIFEELLNELRKRDIKVLEGKAGVNIIEEDKLSFYIISPGKEYSNTNNTSIVTRLIYKDFSLMIMGDAELEVERDLMEEGYKLKSSVLRLGHHGSSTSSSPEFMKAVDPDYSIISLGKDNTYGHPHRETLATLKGMDTKVYRTDELGTIKLKYDGKEISINNVVEGPKEFEEGLSDDQLEGLTYIGNKNSKIVHLSTCNSLPGEKNQIFFKSLKESKAEGYEPHKICLP